MPYLLSFGAAEERPSTNKSDGTIKTGRKGERARYRKTGK